MRPKNYRLNLMLMAQEYDRLGCWYLRDLIRKWLEEHPEEAK